MRKRMERMRIRRVEKEREEGRGGGMLRWIGKKGTSPTDQRWLDLLMVRRFGMIELKPVSGNPFRGRNRSVRATETET